MLNLAGFNSTIYSFNNKTWVSLTPKLSGISPMVMMMLVKAVTLMVIQRDLMLMGMTLDDNCKTANAD